MLQDKHSEDSLIFADLDLDPEGWPVVSEIASRAYYVSERYGITVGYQRLVGFPAYEKPPGPLQTPSASWTIP